MKTLVIAAVIYHFNLKKTLTYLASVLIIGIACISCDDDDDKIYSPKPRGYFRIDFPEKKYVSFDTLCPYQFEIPAYAKISNDKHKNAEPCWYNIEFPEFGATIHLSYKPIHNDLNVFLEDSRNFAVRHQIKATGLDESVVIRDSAKVYGLVYDISGNTASSVQFYLTDSTQHFLRGALYFNAVPNIDSLKLVVDFLREDIIHLVKTCKWKEIASVEKKTKN